jgi:hypothetical protein
MTSFCRSPTTMKKLRFWVQKDLARTTVEAGETHLGTITNECRYTRVTVFQISISGALDD